MKALIHVLKRNISKIIKITKQVIGVDEQYCSTPILLLVRYVRKPLKK